MNSFSPKKVLIPVELEESAHGVLEYGLAFAAKFGAEAVVLHVWEPPRYIGYDVMVSTGSYTQKLIEAVEKQAKAGLEELLTKVQVPEGVVLSSLLETGFATDAITEVCERDQCDHIVMGTHGRSGLSHLLLGSVAERTTRFTSVPVTIVPAKA